MRARAPRASARDGRHPTSSARPSSRARHRARLATRLRVDGRDPAETFLPDPTPEWPVDRSPATTTDDVGSRLVTAFDGGSARSRVAEKWRVVRNDRGRVEPRDG